MANTQGESLVCRDWARWGGAGAQAGNHREGSRQAGQPVGKKVSARLRLHTYECVLGAGPRFL